MNSVSKAASTATHIPVLLGEVLAWLDPRPGDTILDCTLGLGGHAAALLARLEGKGTLIGIDRDKHAIAAATQTLAPYTNTQLLHGNFRDATALLNEAVPNLRVSKVLLDLGFSSMQLGDAVRGFSFQHGSAPLDMRFDDTEDVATAADILNRRPEHELFSIFREYGEEPRADRLAKAVIEQRRKQPFETTADLLEVVHTVKGGGRRTHHPATTVFQALRIAVNDELDAVRAGVPALVELLAPRGRIAVITFHSLEDRIVKQTLKKFASVSTLTLLTKHVVKAGRPEQLSNPRSRSAKLRIAEKN